MAVSVGAAILGGAIIGGGASILGSRSQERGFEESAAESRRQFDLTRQDLAPFRESGVRALDRLNALSEGDTSGFFTSPGFEFRREEGLRGLENRFSASGGALSGNALRRLTEFNSGLASQEFGNFFERQSRLAGLGGAATNVGAQVGANLSGNISNALIGAGNARASGVQGINDAIQGGLGNFLFLRGLQGTPSFQDRPSVPGRP